MQPLPWKKLPPFYSNSPLEVEVLSSPAPPIFFFENLVGGFTPQQKGRGCTLCLGKVFVWVGIKVKTKDTEYFVRKFKAPLDSISYFLISKSHFLLSFLFFLKKLISVFLEVRKVSLVIDYYSSIFISGEE